jgi:S1-C subfamily serine protease
MRWTSAVAVSCLAFTRFLGTTTISLAAQAAPPPLTTETIAARAVPATVTIITFDAAGDTLEMGSGFLVRPTGVIVTNFHVMAGAFRAAVFLASGERYDRVEAVEQDEAGDLAVLKIPGYGLPVLPTAAALPPVGAKLVAVGNPLGLSRTVTEGIVSALRIVDGRQILQMSTAISPGSSGGPVLNARGEVVAVATSYLERGQNLNFAVPVRYAMGLVEGTQTPVPLAQAFGASGRASPDAPGPNSAVTARSVRPARANRPRPTITGTWEIAQRIAQVDGTDAYDFAGYLFLGNHDLGLMVMLREGVDDAKASVWIVQRHTATSDGRLSITMGATALDGYQTDDGFYATGVHRGRDTLQVTLAALPGELPLSGSSGLYTIEAKTMLFGKDGKGTLTFANWNGEAAVAYANDSVYVDLAMTGEHGETTAATLVGPVVKGRFALRTEQGDRLEGTAENGRLHAFWVDQESWGGYSGGLNGTRR